MCDDVFGDEDDTDIPIPEENEWMRIKQSRTAEGFREGIERGENIRLQGGFNDGFRSASPCAFRTAKLRGAITAMLGYYATHSESMLSSMDERLQTLLQDTLDLEVQVASNKTASDAPLGGRALQEGEEQGVCVQADTSGGSTSSAGGHGMCSYVTKSRTHWFDVRIDKLEKLYQEALLGTGVAS